MRYTKEVFYGWKKRDGSDNRQAVRFTAQICDSCNTWQFISAFLYTGGFCNRREDTRSRFSCGGRVNQHYYLFCALFYQWIYRWIWYLSGTALRCERRAWNAKEHRSFNDSQCYICGSADYIVLCAFPSDHSLDEDSGGYC